MSTSRGEDLLCQVLVGRRLPPDATPSEIEHIWDLATWRSVDELLASVLRGTVSRLTPRTRDEVDTRLGQATAREMQRERDVCAIVDALALASVRPLLIKGAGLAYTIYTDPRWRPADDVDLLIARADRAAAGVALERAGFLHQIEPDAELASAQRHYVRGAAGEMQRCVDLHWRVSNRQAFADVVEFERAWSHSTAIPELGDAARTLGTVDALLLACTHRVAHHPGQMDLLWLWDIHLLTLALAADEATDVVDRAAEARVAAVVAHSLTLARDRFGTPFDAALLARLRSVTGEPSARFIGGTPRQVDLLTSDLEAMTSLASRVRLLREHLLPPPGYMRKKYTRWPGILLPLAYLHRIVRGAPRWLRRGGT